MRALVVDDNARTRGFLREILLDDGCFSEVVLSADGLEGLGIVLAGDFDLAIIDIDLPSLDGISLIRAIRKDKPAQAILVLSALALSAYAEQAMRSGANAFLPKGCDSRAILAAAKRIAH